MTPAFVGVECRRKHKPRPSGLDKQAGKDPPPLRRVYRWDQSPDAAPETVLSRERRNTEYNTHSSKFLEYGAYIIRWIRTYG
ncbi:hypothetical protein EYF80_051290 [Liparis tanakae]|uniref:Uncharacterized protein n=1 Tax=Liparis tanakae TaxID=230148 RepID=A0A4Z2FCP1_9TELE|nr:hypothetical protein EYF80_051290 [Liparis tanakae]